MSLRSVFGTMLAMSILTLANAPSRAQGIESLLSPGDVIDGHAEIEAECSECHKSFDKDAQRDLCMSCHEDVATDVQSGAGFHGLHPEAGEAQCNTCHAGCQVEFVEVPTVPGRAVPRWRRIAAGPILSGTSRPRCRRVRR